MNGTPCDSSTSGRKSAAALGVTVELVPRAGHLSVLSNKQSLHTTPARHLRLPLRSDATPARALLTWHPETVFQATLRARRR